MIVLTAEALQGVLANAGLATRIGTPPRWGDGYRAVVAAFDLSEILGIEVFPEEVLAAESTADLHRCLLAAAAETINTG